METKNVKVWFTCPKSHADRLRTIIGDAGFGVIGNYSHCSFVTEGKGYFKPNEKATPHTGEAGKEEVVPMVLIEFRATTDQLPKLKQILAEHHPYEEVGVDVFPLLKF